MKNSLLRTRLILLAGILLCCYTAIAQSIAPISITAKSGDCSATPQEFTFTLTTSVPANPSYSWRIGCPSVVGPDFPPAGSITAVGGTSNAATCTGSGEILNSGTNTTLTIRVNNLTPAATFVFSLDVYDASGTTGVLIIAQDITINVVGDCAATVCCTIASTPNPADETKDPGQAFTPITFSEQNNTTTGLTWKIQFENPPASGTFVDAALANLHGVGFALAASGPFNLVTSTTPVVYLGGTANGVIGTKVKVKVLVTHATGQDETDPFTYAIGDPAIGNALIIPLSVSDTRSPAIPTANCNTALNPVAFKDEATEAATWLVNASNEHAPAVQPVLFSNTVINKPGIDLVNYFNRATQADDFIKFTTDVLDQLSIPANVLDTKRTIILALDNCLESKEGKIAHYATMKEIDYGTKTYQVAVHSRNNTWKDIAHALANNLGVKDVFDLASPPEPLRNTLADWDEMAKTNSNPLPFSGAQPTVFSKLWPTATWIGYSEVTSVEPAIAAASTSPINIVFPYISPSASEKRAIAVLLDASATLSGSSNLYVIIEARDKTGLDANLKSDNGGVIYYLADRKTPEGYSPITSIGNLPLAAGGSTGDSDDLFTRYGIKITSIANYPATGTQKGYTVVVQHQKPNKSDASINQGNPTWTSPDIVVDIPASSSGVCNHGDIFSTNLQNVIKGTIHNTTSFPAVNVQARFLFGCPTPSFAWYEVGSTLVGELAAGADATTSIILEPKHAYPKSGGSGTKTVADCISDGASHICVRVDISALNDGNSSNNSAQQNLNNVTACSGSPYTPIENVFTVRNKESYRTPVFLKATNIPTNWTYSFIPASLNLAPGEEARVSLRLTPPDGFSFCSNYYIPVTAWAPKGHTIIQLGGLSVIAQLREGTKLTMNNKVGPCDMDALVKASQDGGRNVVNVANVDGDNQGKAYHTYDQSGYTNMLMHHVADIYARGRKDKPQCTTIFTDGCTQPPRPNQLVKVMYQDPAGNPIIKEVMTDANGCFKDEFITLEGGSWNITAIFNGDECVGGAMSETSVKVPGPSSGDQDHDNRPDDEEIQGDFDLDNLPPQLDPDSDNDGVVDGDEPIGDYDCDGRPNMIDTDSDNDGVSDDTDPTPYGNTPQYRVFFSAMYHRFDFSSDLPIRDGSGFNIRAGVNLAPRWGLEGEVGFTSTEDVEDESGKVTNINLNALYYFKRATVTPYLTAGAGGLLFNGFTESDNTFALNGGGGIFLTPLGRSGALAVRAEIKGHYGFGGYNTNGNFNIQYSLGISYRIRTKATPCDIEKAIKRTGRK